MTDANLVLGIDASGMKRGASEGEAALDKIDKKAQATERALINAGAKGKSSLNDIGSNAGKASRDIDSLAKRTDDASGAFDRMAGSAKRLAGALLATFGAREVLAASDAYTTLENRLRSVTKSAQEYNQVNSEIFRIAQSSRQDLKAVADLYFRLSGAFTDAQKQAFPLLDITERMGKAFVVTGVEASQAQAFILQLSQAAAADFKGVGQEIGSLIEAAPTLTKAISEELGLKSSAAIKKFAEDGQLNVNNFFQAFNRATDKIVGDFEKMNQTVESSGTRLNNAFTQYIGQSSIVRGATSALVGSINFLADNFNVLATAVALGSAVLGTRYVVALAAARVGTLSLSAVTTGLATVMRALPFVALIGIIATFSEKLGGISGVASAVAQSLDTLGTRALQALSTLGGLASGAVRGTIEAFKKLRDVYQAAGKDLVNAVNPFGENTDFLGRELEEGFGAAFKRGFDSALVESGRFNDKLDAELATRTKARAAKIKEALTGGGGASAPSAASAGILPQQTVPQIKAAEVALGGVAKEAERVRDALSPDKPDGAVYELKESAQIFRDVASDISNGFTNAFEDIFKNGISGFSNMANSIGDMFRRMLARLATLAIAQPIIIPLVQSVGGAFGLSSSTIGDVTKQLGFGDASSIVGGLKGGLLSGNIGGFSGINQFGAKYLGTGLVGQGSVTGASLSAIGAYAGLGGLGASLLGLGTGNQIADSAASAIGAYGGSALASGLGVAAGPLGILGGFAAPAILGALGIGRKKPNPASNFGGVLGAGGFSELTLKSKHMDTETAKSLSDSVNTIAQSLINAGIDVSGQIVQGGVDRGRGFFAVGGFQNLEQGISQGIRFNPNGGDSEIQRAMGDLAIKLAMTTETGMKFADALQRIDTSGRSAESVLSDIQFIAAFERLGDEFIENTTRVTDFEQSVKSMRDQFAAAEENAVRLGLSLEQFASRVAKAEADITRQFNQSVASQITQAGGFGSIIDEVQRFTDQLREAQLVNGDIQQVELLHQLNMQKIIGDTNTKQVTALQEQAREAGGLVAAYQRVSETLRNAINGINVGQFSILSPLQQLQESQRIFDAAFSKAKGGDIEAANSLPGLANTLLSQGQGYFASSTDFAALQRDTVSKLEEAERLAGSQVDIQKRIFDSSEQQIRVLESGFRGVSSAISDLAIAQLASIRGVNGAGFSTSNFNDRVVSLFGSGLTGASGDVASQIRGIFSQTIGNVQEGGGRVTAAFNASPDANQRAFELARNLGILGFANGGTFSGTGLVGENGAEFITTGSQATVIPYQANKEVVQQIRASNDNMRMMINVMQQGFLQMIDKQSETVNALRESGRTQRVSGKRKDA